MKKLIMIDLSYEQAADLEEMAKVLGVEGIDGAGLAKLWILERLVAIRRPFPTVHLSNGAGELSGVSC